MAWMGFGVDGATPFLGDPSEDWQAEACAAAGWFGGEEGLEDAVEVFRGDSTARIGEAEKNALGARLGEDLEASGCVGGKCVGGLDGIFDEDEEYVFEFGGIAGESRERSGFGMEGELQGSDGDGIGEGAEDAFDERGESDGFEAARLGELTDGPERADGLVGGFNGVETDGEVFAEGIAIRSVTSKECEGVLSEESQGG